MEMSGNLNEACVTVGNVEGRSYGSSSSSLFNINGDGDLAASGNAIVDYWPGNGMSDDAEVTTSNGTIIRGGAFDSPADELRISNRSQGVVPSTREANQGGRGVIF